MGNIVGEKCRVKIQIWCPLLQSKKFMLKRHCLNVVTSESQSTNVPYIMKFTSTLLYYTHILFFPSHHYLLMSLFIANFLSFLRCPRFTKYFDYHFGHQLKSDNDRKHIQIGRNLVINYRRFASPNQQNSQKYNKAESIYKLFSV